MKDTKSDFKKNFLGQYTGNINTKFVNRRNEIASLGEEATKEIMTLLRNNGLLHTDNRGQLSFDIRKFRQKGKVRLQRYETKSLSHGYEQERGSWLLSGKTGAISGTVIHGYSSENQIGMFESTIGRAKKRGQVVTKRQEQSWQNIKQHGGTSQDWKIFGELGQAIKQDMPSPPSSTWWRP